MKFPPSIAAATLTTLLALAPAAHAQASNLDTVLRQMDAASLKFQTAEADFHWDLYERVVRQTTTQTGTIYFQKKGATLQMGAVIAPPSARTLEYKDAKLRIFDPGTDHITQLSAGTNQAQYESFLTLGFGGSGKDLEKAWTVTDAGTEPINDGEKTVLTTKLDLVSKDPSVRNMFSHVTIWVDPSRGISLKQVFVQPSEDQRTALYTHIRYNTKIDAAGFAIKTDKKTTIDRR
jgi:outer membrane lipoprotein-sorting protein